MLRVSQTMPTRRFLVALVSAPAAAAVTFYFLWLAWLVFFVSNRPGEVLADWNAAISLWRTWPIVAVAFVCAFVMELVVGLPLLAFFRCKGWLSLPAFLVGGCVAALAYYIVTHWAQLPAQQDLGVAMVLLLVPGCVGAVVFGYVGPSNFAYLDSSCKRLRRR